MSEDKKFSFDELKGLNRKDNLHLLLHGKVYAITKFLDEHPGGDEVLLGEAGKDATEAFEDVGHSDEARELLKKYLVGEGPEGAPKGARDVKQAQANAAQKESAQNFTYLLPLAGLVAYLAYRFYEKQQGVAV